MAELKRNRVWILWLVEKKTLYLFYKDKEMGYYNLYKPCSWAWMITHVRHLFLRKL